MSFSAGLVHLPRTFRPSPNIQPIALPTECGNNLENIEVVAVGNGLTYRGGRRHDTLLRHVNLTTMSFEDCNDYLTKKHDLSYSVICTRVSSGRSICNGDSGEYTNTKSDKN